eukprot:690537-Rhodomonas_salina.1
MSVLDIAYRARRLIGSAHLQYLFARRDLHERRRVAGLDRAEADRGGGRAVRMRLFAPPYAPSVPPWPRHTRHTRAQYRVSPAIRELSTAQRVGR